MGLSLQNIDKIVGRETHLKDISLEFDTGSRNVLLGRTLAGKTSLLRIMAGIEASTITSFGACRLEMPLRVSTIASSGRCW